jgi:L-malate glycosyltransferase
MLGVAPPVSNIMEPRLLYFGPACYIHTVRFANAFSERGWDVHLASLHDSLPELSPKVTYHRSSARPKHGYVTAASWAKRLVKTLRPALIHAHYASGYGLLGALSGAHPLLLSVFGSDVYDFPEISPLHRWLVQWNLKRSDYILSITRAMADRTRALSDRPIAITPWGVDTELFNPATRGRDHVVAGLVLKPSDIVIGTVKTLEPKYGIEYLIDAFHLVSQRHPNLPLKLVIIGRGWQRSQLEAQVCSLGMAERTAFTGPISYNDIPRYTQLLDVGAYLSVLDSESLGVAVLEACACAKAVVVSSVGGLPEVVVDGVTGLVVSPRSATAAADALERLVLDAALCQRLGTAGRKRVLESYSWNASVDIMHGIYKDVLQKSGDRLGDWPDLGVRPVSSPAV